MKEFVLLFRQPDPKTAEISEIEKKSSIKRWEDWFGGIAAQGVLVSMGMRLNDAGKVLKKGGVITDGPYVEIRERLNGFIIVRADHLDDAVTLAHGCPAIDRGGSVEIRPYLPEEQPKIKGFR